MVTRREVSTEEAKELADKHGVEYTEVSAKTSLNTEAVFTHIATKILANMGIITLNAPKSARVPTPAPIDNRDLVDKSLAGYSSPKEEAKPHWR